MLTTGAWIGSGDQVEAIISMVSDIVLEASRLHVAVWLNASLLFVLMALFFAHRDLKKKFHLTEALLLEKSIGVHSRNWTATAINLEKKAQEPGDVARSSALTFLHLLDGDSLAKGRRRGRRSGCGHGATAPRRQTGWVAPHYSIV